MLDLAILCFMTLVLCVSRLWDRSSIEEVKTLTFDTSVSSMEYVADGEILVITYGRTVAFYNALRSLRLLYTSRQQQICTD